MAVKTEVAELMNKSGRVYEVAEKVVGKCDLTAEDREIAEVVDAWASEIGKTGNDSEHEVSALILKTIEEPVYDKPDDIIDMMFDKDSIGEFDGYEVNKEPKNTLIAYDGAKGGNVDKSYIDNTILKPTWKHGQVETSLTYGQLRRNGFKNIANIAVYAKESLDNKKIKDVFSVLDSAITGGEQVISVTGGADALTQANMDALALYVMDSLDSGDSAFCFGLNKYAQAVARMAGHANYMSDRMKDEYNKYGLVKEYLGLLIGGFSGAKKAADGELLVPDKRLFGIGGKVGTICDRGDLRVYQTMDNNKEKIDLKFTGYEYGISIARPDKVAKITFTA